MIENFTAAQARNRMPNKTKIIIRDLHKRIFEESEKGECEVHVTMAYEESKTLWAVKKFLEEEGYNVNMIIREGWVIFEIDWRESEDFSKNSIS